MKKVKIVSDCFVPSEKEGQMKPAYVNSVLNVEDKVAGELIAAQRAVIADKDDKLVDTTRQRETALDEQAARVSDPMSIMAAAVATAIVAAQAKAAKPAAL